MSQKSNVNLQAIAYISAAGVAGVLLGTLLIAPMISKYKAKKMKQKAVTAKKA